MRRVLLLKRWCRKDALRSVVLMMVDDTDWCLHAVIMQAVLSVTRRGFTIRSGLIDSDGFWICDLLRVNGRNILVRTSHLLLHCDLLVILIVATSSTFIPNSLGLVGLGI